MKTIAFNVETNRCGCILIQRFMGATVTAEDISGLPWEKDSLAGMRLYPFDDHIRKVLEALCATA